MKSYIHVPVTNSHNQCRREAKYTLRIHFYNSIHFTSAPKHHQLQKVLPKTKQKSIVLNNTSPSTFSMGFFPQASEFLSINEDIYPLYMIIIQVCKPQISLSSIWSRIYGKYIQCLTSSMQC